MVAAQLPSVSAKDFDLDELWHCFIAGGRCACHRSRLLALYYPMAIRVSKSFGRRHGVPVDMDEMVSWGTFGLVHAIDTWDPTRNTRFESWASVHIRGRIIDELRTQDWAPRTIRRRQRELDIAYEHLLNNLRREPTTAELAEVIGTTERDVKLRVHETEAARLKSLEESFDPDDDHAVEPRDPNIDIENEDMMIRMVQDVAHCLDAKSRFILVLYYIEGLSLEQVAQVLGITEHRVSRIHASAARTVRALVRASLTE